MIPLFELIPFLYTSNFAILSLKLSSKYPLSFSSLSFFHHQREEISSSVWKGKLCCCLALYSLHSLIFQDNNNLKTRRKEKRNQGYILSFLLSLSLSLTVVDECQNSSSSSLTLNRYNKSSLS